MDCYDEILETYKNSHKSKKTQLRIFKFLNILTKPQATTKYSKLEIKNCLILLLSLFFQDESDNFNTKGKLNCELSANEKEQLGKILKTELN